MCVFFSHASPCQGGVTRAQGGSDGCFFFFSWGGGWLESELVCWDGCDHVSNEGGEEEEGLGVGGALALEGGCCLDASKINILWTLPLH